MPRTSTAVEIQVNIGIGAAAGGIKTIIINKGPTQEGLDTDKETTGEAAEDRAQDQHSSRVQDRDRTSS